MRKISDPSRVVIPAKCSLYLQPRSSLWYCSIKLTDGKWYRQATNERDIKNAKEKALELYYEAKVKGINKLPTNSRSFSSVAKTIVDRLKALKDTKDWKPTYKSYISVINKYQIPYFAQGRLEYIRDKYEGYLEHITTEIGRTPAQSTIANHHAALKMILTQAHKSGWITDSTLPIFRNIGTQSIRRPTFEMDEYRTLITKLRHWSAQKSHTKRDTEIRLMLYDYVLVLAHSGIRHGREAMDIKWSNVSFEKSRNKNDIVTINVTKKKGRRGTEERRTVVVRHNEISNFKKVLERLKNRHPQLQSLSLKEIIINRMNVSLFC